MYPWLCIMSTECSGDRSNLWTTIFISWKFYFFILYFVWYIPWLLWCEFPLWGRTNYPSISLKKLYSPGGPSRHCPLNWAASHLPDLWSFLPPRSIARSLSLDWSADCLNYLWCFAFQVSFWPSDIWQTNPRAGRRLFWWSFWCCVWDVCAIAWGYWS